MSRNNTNFDNKVRNYVIKHYMVKFWGLDEYTYLPCFTPDIHELFSGKNRVRCFYIRDAMYFVSRASHAKIHQNPNDKNNMKLLQNRLKQKGENYTTEALETYLNELKIFIEKFSIKDARLRWKDFFNKGCIGTMPLLFLNLEETI